MVGIDSLKKTASCASDFVEQTILLWKVWLNIESTLPNLLYNIHGPLNGSNAIDLNKGF